MNKNCDICEAILGAHQTDYCLVCGWDFSEDLTKRAFYQTIVDAKTQSLEIIALKESISSLENEIKLLETQLVKRKDLQQTLENELANHNIQAQNLKKLVENVSSLNVLINNRQASSGLPQRKPILTITPKINGTNYGFWINTPFAEKPSLLLALARTPTMGIDKAVCVLPMDTHIKLVENRWEVRVPKHPFLTGTYFGFFTTAHCFKQTAVRPISFYEFKF
jgi:uncharacterized small protein (DUF1192 family)